jgi:hypothetical protein
VLASESEIHSVAFAPDPRQFTIFDQIIRGELQKCISAAGKEIKSPRIPLIRGASLSIAYHNIEGSNYSQKFDFYFQPHNYSIVTDDSGIIDTVTYSVTVLAEPQGIAPPDRSALSIYIRQ